MTKVPNIKPSDTSFLAYYNLQDTELNGEFNPTELNFGTDMYTRFSTGEGTVYDNGYKFTLEDTLMNSTITIRAGNDGHRWVTAHIKNYNNGGDFTGKGADLSTYSYSNDTNGGEYDIMPWKNSTVYEPTENSLFTAIKKSLINTDYWTRSELNMDNAGMYDYSVDDLSQQISIFSSDLGTSGLAFTDNTTIYKVYIVGYVKAGDNNDGSDLAINGTKCFGIYNKARMRFALDVTEIVEEDNELNLLVSKIDEAIGSYNCIVVWS